MKIPDDLRAFLNRPEARKLALRDCEAREVALFRPEELAEAEYDVSTAHVACQEQWEGWESIPDERYWFRGVNLVKECGNYSPEGLFIWFPELGLYGQWDSDHHQIIIFPGVSWSDIIKDPDPYFGGQWEPNRVWHEYLRPWETND